MVNEIFKQESKMQPKLSSSIFFLDSFVDVNKLSKPLKLLTGR